MDDGFSFFSLVAGAVLFWIVLQNRRKQKQERLQDLAQLRDLTTRIYLVEQNLEKLKAQGVVAEKAQVPAAEKAPDATAPRTAERKVPEGIAAKVTAPAPVLPAYKPAPPPPPPKPIAPLVAEPKPVPSVLPAPPVRTPERPAPPITPPPYVKREAPPKPAIPLSQRIEEALGTNWLSKIGIAFIVIAAVFLLKTFFPTSPLGRTLVGCAIGGLLLGGGVWLEIKDRYRILARAGIGGGWALLFFLSWAVHYVPATQIVSSAGVDLVLMLATAAVMVWHTLHYRSQAITGLAFLLAFVSLGISVTDGSVSSAASLAAGVLLAAALVVIVGRMQWFELEVAGIFGSYLNHYLWLRPIIEPMQGQHHDFPELKASAAILFLYWLIFRLSYVFRLPANREKERVSGLAALLNPALLLTLLKYQSVHPEWAFWGLLAIGAVETALAQLPVTRRRRSAVIVLSTLGVVLLVAAFPLRYSGTNLSVLWLLESEALLLIGVWTREIVFRRLGMLTALLVSGHMVVASAYPVYAARAAGPVSSSDYPLALVFALAAALFYGNSHWVSRRWADLFSTGFDRQLANRLSYLAALMAFIAAWLAFPEIWTAVAWCALGAALAWTGRRLASNALLYQAGVISASGVVRALAVNLEASQKYQVLSWMITQRSVTIGLVAALLYLTSRWTWEAIERRRTLTWLRMMTAGYSWSASTLLGLLMMYELSDAGIAVAWAGFALALALAGRRFSNPDLTYQSNAAALAAVIQTFDSNLSASQMYHGFSLRLITVSSVAVLLYLTSRWSWPEAGGRPANAFARRFATAAYLWAGTALLAVLAWYEVRLAAVAVVWAFGSLVLALVGRRFSNRDLTYQANALALAAFVRALAVNYTAIARWHGLTHRLISVLTVAALLYVISRWSWAEEAGDREFYLGSRSSPLKNIVGGAYLWAGSFLLSLLAWYELEPVSVGVAWATGGLVLLELGLAYKSISPRLQAYALLLAAFARIFFVNLNAGGEGMSPRLYTVVPIALAFFYAYWRLLESPGLDFEKRSRAAELCCWMGVTTLAALLRFELLPDWVATGWAALALLLAATGWARRQRVFLYQALLLSVGIGFRTVLHNFYQRSYFPPVNLWQSRWALVGSTVLLMF
ncbi:MAG TPA: DUF2339 domain-containing protein, partial [Terriglobales bacterium]